MQRRGIVEPPIDDLMERADSKYQLVIFSAKRARQINSYYSDLGDGNIYEHVGPLVPSTVDEKPLSIALREIHEGKLVMAPRQD
jgi:DNA-directed RNA polymerase subunit omega